MALKRRPPANNVVRHQVRGKNIRGTTMSKTGQIVQYESQLQHRLILETDRNPTVARYISYPEIYEYRDQNAQLREHVPALMVWRTTGEVEILDIVQADSAKRGEELHRQRQISHICSARGWRYVVYTEKSLPGETRFANLLAMVQFRPRCYRHEAISKAIVNTLTMTGRMQVVRLLQEISTNFSFSYGQVAQTVGHIIWHGAVQVNWDQLLIADGEFLPGNVVWME